MQRGQRRPAPRRAGRRRPPGPTRRAPAPAARPPSSTRRLPATSPSRRPRPRRRRRGATPGSEREPAAGSTCPAAAVCAGSSVSASRYHSTADRGATPTTASPASRRIAAASASPGCGTAADVCGELHHVDRQAGVPTGHEVGGDPRVHATPFRRAEIVVQGRADDGVGEAVPGSGRLEDARPGSAGRRRPRRRVDRDR